MIRNSRGFGILGLILSLGVMVGVLYFMMSQHQSGKSNEAALNQLEKDSIPSTGVGAAVENNLSRATHESDRRADCAVEEQNCSVK